MQKRIDRVNELVKKTVGEIIETNFKPEGTLVTVTHVKTSPDLHNAQVFLSFFPYEKKEESIIFIKENLHKIQEEFGGKISLKFTPKLEAILDESLEYGSQIDSLLDKISRDKIDR